MDANPACPLCLGTGTVTHAQAGLDAPRGFEGTSLDGVMCSRCAVGYDEPSALGCDAAAAADPRDARIVELEALLAELRAERQAWIDDLATIELERQRAVFWARLWKRAARHSSQEIQMLWSKLTRESDLDD